MRYPLAAGAGEVVEFPGFSDITYMQDMTDHKCYIAEVGETKQLIDSRDNKKYWVSKLADGNCWMVQNLDFDVPETLSSSTSDVSGESVETGITGPTSLANWQDDNTVAQYYDPGDYYYNGPNGAHAQGSNCHPSGINSETLAKCAQFSTTGDSHYHVGNYYSWIATTAGSDIALAKDGDDAMGSICPKGWSLPLSGSNNTVSGSFYYLLDKYLTWNSSNNTFNLTNGDCAVYKSPLYFVYGGRIYSETLNYTGGFGGYWSSTTLSNVFAYGLSFDGGGVHPSYYGSRSGGASVRCVAK